MSTVKWSILLVTLLRECHATFLQFVLLFYRTLDTVDQNGLLDLREFILGIELVGARTPEAKLEWAFRMHDMDNSGNIDPKEMDHIMQSVYNMLDVVGAKPNDDPSEKAKKIFQEIDVNDDGLLSKEEFLRGCMNDAELMMLLEKLFNFLTEGMD